MRTGSVVVACIGVAALVAAGTGCLTPDQPTLTGVTMSNAGLTDTVTFTFFDKPPSTTTATYTGTTLPQGSGGTDFPFEIDGKTYIHVVLSGAVAHDMRGRGTAQAAVYAMGMTSIAETALLEDYEGYVHYVIGLSTTTAPEIGTAKSGHVFKIMVTKT